MENKIITFYSFKGGSGRSQLTANLAAYLCYYENKKILLIDWDLEAPGLDYFFKFDRSRIKKGLIEVFEEYISIASSGKKIELSELPGLNDVYSIAEEKAYNPIKKDKKGKIDIIPAANYNNGDYTHRINKFDWFEFYKNLEGRYYIEFLKEELKKKDYDFIFIDSRTGISDYLGICNIQLPDINIIVVAPSKQNLDGAFKIATKILEHPYTKANRINPIVLPVFSRIDIQYGNKYNEWIELFLSKFSEIINNTLMLTKGISNGADNFIRNATINYEADLAYGETIKFGNNLDEIGPGSIQEKFIGIWRSITQSELEIEYNFFPDFSDNRIPRLLTDPPYQPDFFIGREEDLMAIESEYQQQQRLLVLVNGEGGIGKTTLAAKYWYAHAERYKHLAWLYADAGIGTALVSLKEKLGVTFDQNDDLDTQVQRITEALNNLEKPCLLVFDNANADADLKKYYTTLNKLPNCHILLTSRVRKLANIKVHEVKPLTEAEALRLFKHHYPDLPDADRPMLHEVLKAVGHNTLVTEVLAKNMAVFNRFALRYSLADLLADLQAKGLLALKNKAVAVVYGSDKLREAEPTDIIAAMYDLAKLSEEERYLLSNLAVLPAENIAYTLLTSLLGTAEDALEAPLSSLEEKGWLEYRKADNTFKISPVIQEVTRSKNVERLLADCRALVRSLTIGLDDDNRHTDNYQPARVFAHLGSALIHALPIPDFDLVVLCQNIGNYHQDTGNLFLMLQSYQKMLDIQTALCAAKPDNAHFKNGLAVSYSKLGETHSNLGDLELALGFFEERNKLGKELYAADPTNVAFKHGLAISYEKLGETHSRLGDLEQALAFFKDETKLFEELYMAYPTNVAFKHGLAISYEKLGSTLSTLGQLDQALEFFEERNKLGKELYTAYPTNVEFKNGLAISYEKLGETHSSLGDLDAALRHFEDFNRLEKELYVDYPTNVSFKNGLATAACWLGIIHSNLGDLKQALEFFEVYNRLEKELYAAYPTNVGFKNSLAVSYQYLGYTHSSLGDLNQALAFFEKDYELSKELHTDYPTNVEFKNSLAISHLKLGETYGSLGDLEQALFFFEEYNRLEKELYTDYPTNVSFKNGLAVSYYKLGGISQAKKDTKKARAYFQQAEALWLELVKDAPQYVEFQKFLDIVQGDIKSLD